MVCVCDQPFAEDVLEEGNASCLAADWFINMHARKRNVSQATPLDYVCHVLLNVAHCNFEFLTPPQLNLNAYLVASPHF